MSSLNKSWQFIQSTFNDSTVNSSPKRKQVTLSVKKRPKNNSQISSLPFSPITTCKPKKLLHSIQASSSFQQNNVIIDDSDSDEENANLQILQSPPKRSPIKKYKKNKLNNKTTSSHLINENSSSATSFDYDPDYDNNSCNGCFIAKSTKSYPLLDSNLNFNRPSIKSPSSVQHRQSTKEYLNSLVSKSNDKIIETKDIFNIDEDSSEIDQCSLKLQDVPPSTIIIDDDSSVSNSCDNKFIEENIITEQSQSSSSSSPLSNPIVQKPKDLLKKRIKPKKGGYLEKLYECLNETKSDYAFWHHENLCGLDNSSNCQVEMTVQQVNQDYGCFILRTVKKKNVKQQFILCMDSQLKLCTKIRKGVKINVDLIGARWYQLNSYTVYPNIYKVSLAK